AFLAQLISAGTLIAFMFVTLGIYRLRPREGQDIAKPRFRMPFYPVLPAVAFLGSLVVFLGLDIQAKLYSGVWFLIGCAIYFLYGMRHSALTLTKGSEVEKETEALEQAKSNE
ncbi:amino acid permease, partial [Lacticaseibacillus rhamnosus]